MRALTDVEMLHLREAIAGYEMCKDTEHALIATLLPVALDEINDLRRRLAAIHMLAVNRPRGP